MGIHSFFSITYYKLRKCKKAVNVAEGGLQEIVFTKKYKCIK